MSDSQKMKKKRFNALDVAVVLLIFLVMLGIAGRVVLDRRNNRKMETRTVSFTCILPNEDADRLQVGSTFKDERGNKLGTLTEIVETVVYSHSKGESTDEYYSITGNMTVRGYEGKDGVFYSANGLCFRMNTNVNVRNGIELCLYINDIVENGQ